MFYRNQPKPMIPFWIFTTLLLALLTVWGCDHSVEIPTSESIDVATPVEMELNASLSAAPAAANIIPLNRYWNAITTDYLTIALPKPPLGAPAQGHVFQAIVGHIFAVQQPGTVPLKLFWHNTRKDYLTTTANAVPPGYVIVRVEGFVFQKQQSGTVPLKLFWHAAQQDYLTTTGVAPAGYVNVRAEGFVLP